MGVKEQSKAKIKYTAAAKICRLCGTPNVSRSNACRKCGGKLVRNLKASIEELERQHPERSFRRKRMETVMKVFNNTK